MKYYEIEFTIEGLDNLSFKFKKMSPIDILTCANSMLQAQENDDMYKRYLITALENTEVKVMDKWFPVKEKGSEIYYPAGMEENLSAMFFITNRFFSEVIKPVFFGLTQSQEKQA